VLSLCSSSSTRATRPTTPSRGRCGRDRSPSSRELRSRIGLHCCTVRRRRRGRRPRQGANSEDCRVRLVSESGPTLAARLAADFSYHPYASARQRMAHTTHRSRAIPLARLRRATNANNPLATRALFCPHFSSSGKNAAASRQLRAQGSALSVSAWEARESLASISGGPSDLQDSGRARAVQESRRLVSSRPLSSAPHGGGRSIRMMKQRVARQLSTGGGAQGEGRIVGLSELAEFVGAHDESGERRVRYCALWTGRPCVARHLVCERV